MRDPPSPVFPKQPADYLAHQRGARRAKHSLPLGDRVLLLRATRTAALASEIRKGQN